MTTRQVFLNELEQLNKNVIKMGTLLEQSINDMIIALNKTDADLANKIIERDDEIDHLEHQIEKDCILLIAKQQPLASDLRRIASVMKIITDIERIADHCADISEYIIKIAANPPMKAPAKLIDMVNGVKSMVIKTIDGYVKQDLDGVREVYNSDDAIDEYFEVLVQELSNTMQENIELVPQCINYILIVKYLERMGDHATNIAEWIEYIITGKIIASQ